jgi:hypothetical protein
MKEIGTPIENGGWILEDEGENPQACQEVVKESGFMEPLLITNIPETSIQLIRPSSLEGQVERGSTISCSMDPSLRGDLIHQLLHFLPRISPHKWEQGANHILQKYDLEIESGNGADIYRVARNVITHPDYQSYWGENSRGEVPVTGWLKNKTQRLVGRIDRLVVEDNQVLIIDYKTTLSPPEDPTPYFPQLRAYGDVLGKIYPHHDIQGVIIWTETLEESICIIRENSIKVPKLVNEIK